jgi:hypothetical protein
MCAGSLTFGVSGAIEGRQVVAIDNDILQFPLAAGRIAATQEQINKEHRKRTLKKDSRRDYDLKLPTHRFLNPLDTSDPSATYQRQQEREAARQQKIDFKGAQSGDDDAVEGCVSRKPGKDGAKSQESWEDLFETEKVLLEMALEQSKWEAKRTADVSSHSPRVLTICVIGYPGSV